MKTIRSRGRPKKEGETFSNAQEALIDAAKKVFSEKGYEGATVKDLSKEANVNVSLVSYYFDGKKGLYDRCMQGFGEDRLQIALKLLQEPKNLTEFELRLKLFAEEILEGFVKEPELTRLLFKEFDEIDSRIEGIIENVFIKFFKAIINYFELAKKNEIIRGDIDAYTLTSIFFGSLSHFARSQHLSLKYFERDLSEEKSRKKIVEHILEIYLKGILLQSQWS